MLDAQLPLRLARALSRAGHDVVHTSELLRGNASTDHEVCEVADRQERVVVTKDRDFHDSHLLRRVPRRLLIVTTGNTSNTALPALFEEHGAAVVSALKEADCTTTSGPPSGGTAVGFVRRWLPPAERGCVRRSPTADGRCRL